MTAAMLLIMSSALIPACNRFEETKEKSSTTAISNTQVSEAPKMVLISGGEFLMGCPREDQASRCVTPRQRTQGVVRVRGFYMSRYPVTAEDYCRFLNDIGKREPEAEEYGKFYPSSFGANIELVDGIYRPRPGCRRSPATRVNWVGANAHCEWLSKKTGRPYRLPTESEWEYAARGSELRPWPWGSKPEIDKSTSRAYSAWKKKIQALYRRSKRSGTLRVMLQLNLYLTPVHKYGIC